MSMSLVSEFDGGEDPPLGLLGLQLEHVLAFIESDFQSDAVVDDHVRARRVLLSSMFTKDDQLDLWMLSSESLPGSPDLKAVLFDEENLLLETSPLDIGEVVRFLAENEAGYFWNPKKKCFESVEGDWRIDVSEPSIPDLKIDGEHGESDIQLSPRILWEIDISKMDQEERFAAVRFVDSIDDAGMYSFEEEGGAPSGKPEMKLVLDMRLQMRLAMEQRPILALRQRMEPGFGTEQILELNVVPMLRMGQILGSLPAHQAESFLKDLAERKGPEIAYNVLVFTLARRTKSALELKHGKPVPWKIARKAARQLVNQAIISGSAASG